MTSSDEVSARDLMEEIVARAMIEAAEALKKEHRGNENLINRDIKSLHGNTTKDDLPDYLKKAVSSITTSMFGYINRMGYVLVPQKGRNGK
jgi:hypothetical protein